MRSYTSQVAMALTRELLRHCTWSRLDWKKLLVVGSFMAAFGILVPGFLFPNYQAAELSSSISSTKQIHEWPIPIHALGLSNTSNEMKKQISGRRSPSGRRRRKGKKNNVEMKESLFLPPPRKPLQPQLQKYISNLPPEDALRYARHEIDNAPLVTDNPYLHAPIFKNFSAFKSEEDGNGVDATDLLSGFGFRSYELMEMILKVYIYDDGERPIFHEPHLYGIYASEGWFMKLMESSRNFITEDSEKAHLFYLPYSARQLQLAVYVPNSHNLKPLAIFIKNFANMIASKYPFWNRTKGKDHFVVACHDWGPYTLTLHQELRRNAIKALCNADVSEGIFIAGRDVSLPETTIRNPRRPLGNIGGGVRVSQRPILAFFAGNMHGRVRPLLIKHWHNKDDDMKIYKLLPRGVSRKMSYVQHMKSSRFCICPMGYEVNSPRIVEAIYYECVPVIIADNFVLPLSEVLDWSAFSVVVAEKDIPLLKEILIAIPLRKYLTMLHNLKMAQKHFLWNSRPIRYDIFHMILHSIWVSRVNQISLSQSLNATGNTTVA